MKKEIEQNGFSFYFCLFPQGLRILLMICFMKKVLEPPGKLTSFKSQRFLFLSVFTLFFGASSSTGCAKPKSISKNLNKGKKKPWGIIQNPHYNFYDDESRINFFIADSKFLLCLLSHDIMTDFNKICIFPLKGSLKIRNWNMMQCSHTRLKMIG